jgi:hypothetical protein
MASLLVRDALAGPGTHALVVGVSDYPFADENSPTSTRLGRSLGIRNLTSAARSASEFVGWLLEDFRDPDCPLASVRLLLSPVAGEDLHASIAANFAHVDLAATRQALEVELGSFRQACRSNRDNRGIVYMAGHGVQLTKRGATVLLQDFASDAHVNELGGAVDVIGCHDGMDEDGSAAVQLWFVDACRQVPAIARQFERLEGALTLSEQHGQVTSSPVFLASSSQQSAFATIGGTTLFNQALLWALRGAAAQGPDGVCDEWYVGVSQLVRRLDPQVADFAATHGEVQTIDVTGRVREAVAHRFAGPPSVNVSFVLSPELAADHTQASLRFNGSGPPQVWGEWPHHSVVPAGLYQLEVTSRPPFRDSMSLLDVRPPTLEERVEVG